MDTTLRPAPLDPLTVTGLGAAHGAGCDPGPFLRERRMRKFMALQDVLALSAAGAAAEQARLFPAVPGERVGLFLAVGHVAFEARDLEPLVESACEEGRFSMTRLCALGLDRMNPLLTFRVLPNMPAFHVSLNLGLRGPYFVTFPGAPQLYLALEQACLALEAGLLDAALVGGVAHQRNFLVEQHLGRQVPPVPAERLHDAAGFLVLERAEAAAARGAPTRGRLLELAMGYARHDPLRGPPVPDERWDGAAPEADHGAASLPVLLARRAAAGGAGLVEHTIEGRDGVAGRSRWEVAP